VVAERDHVRAGGEQRVGELGRDAGAVGRVLAVDDREVDVELVAQPGQALLDGAATCDAEDVRQKEDSQSRLPGGTTN
jgi:hypothetical protein